MDRLTAMMSFVKVVENAGFSAAARRLDLSASVVTMHVKSLEDRLGVLLLNRSTRNVSPTEIGQSYYERCLQILAETDEADEVAQSSQLKPRGVVSNASAASAGSGWYQSSDTYMAPRRDPTGF